MKAGKEGGTHVGVVDDVTPSLASDDRRVLFFLFILVIILGGGDIGVLSRFAFTFTSLGSYARSQQLLWIDRKELLCTFVYFLPVTVS